MSDHKEVMQQALHALVWNKSYLPNGHPTTLSNGAISALTAATAQPEQSVVTKVLSDLISYAEGLVCTHESTHRSGAIWEICDHCGMKWADDLGGKPKHKQHSAITNALAALKLSAIAQQKTNGPEGVNEMADYLKKPIVIQAVQWDGTYLHAKHLENELGLNSLGMTAHPPSNKVSWWKISTCEDGHVVSPMDWIITGVKGEHYPCKPDIFELTYETAIAHSEQPTPPFGDTRKAAMAVYKPPFHYASGYIFDSQNLMVADNGRSSDDVSVQGAVASRVRGWGRLRYLPNGAELQDEIGRMVADALSALYASIAQPEQTAPQPAQPAQPAQVGEIAALRKDAERYRWLRSIGHDQMNVLGHYAGDAMDVAIDAAIAQPATERNFCPRCGKRLGGVDDVHTCTAPAHLNLSKKTVEKLHTFLDASAGDGVISDRVDAADLYIEIFPEQYAESVK